MFLLFACTDTPAPATPADTAPEEEEGPWSMPDRSGCTVVWEYDEDLDGTYETWVSERYAEGDLLTEKIARSDWRDWTATITLDGACTVAYRYDEVIHESGEITTLEWTATCDEHDNQVHREGDWNGEPFTTEMVNTYEDDHLVRRVETEESADGTTVWEFTYDWDGDLVTHETWSIDGELYREETHTYDEHGWRIGWTDGSNVYEWTYDEHGREIGEVHAEGGSPDRRTSTTWYEGIFHASWVDYEEYDGDDEPDGALAYTCTESWPWTCDGVYDGSWPQALRESWSCP